MKIKNNEIPEELKKYAHNDERTVDELTNYVQRVIDETSAAIEHIADAVTVIEQNRDNPIVRNNVEFDTEYGTYTYDQLTQYLITNYHKAQDMRDKATSVLQQLVDSDYPVAEYNSKAEINTISL